MAFKKILHFEFLKENNYKRVKEVVNNIKMREKQYIYYIYEVYIDIVSNQNFI